MDKKKILIVDDEETSIRMLKLAVGERNHELVFARNGREAVECARREKPDLILMDVMLPEMNGYEATRAIKSEELLRNIPVIAITARTVDYDEEMAREAGCDGYLTKPFRVGDLRQELNRYLSRSAPPER